MERIINDEALFEDAAEGIANVLDVSILKVMPLLTDDMMKGILDEMFKAESQEIHRIAKQIQKDL